MFGVRRSKATVCGSSVDKEDTEGGVCELRHHRQKQQHGAKKKANSSPAPESPQGPIPCLLLAVVILLFMSFVVFALNFCCKIASFSPLGQGISDARRARCTPWRDSLPGPEAQLRRTEVASARSECKRVRIHGKACSSSSASPAPGRPDSLSRGISSLRSVSVKLALAAEPFLFSLRTPCA